MKRIALFVFCLLASFAFAMAQEQEEGRFSLSAEIGSGYLLANSNVSPYGVHSRGEFNHGVTGNVKLAYQLDKLWKAGVKYNLFAASENYAVEDGTLVANDLNLHYIAPQIGFNKAVSPRIRMDYAIGAGCMIYQNKGLYGNDEREYSKTFFGANIDFSLDYKLYRNFYLGLGASLTGGKTSSLDEKTGNDKHSVDLDKWNRIKVMRADVFLAFKMRM